MANSPFFCEQCGYDPDRSYSSMELPLRFLSPELSRASAVLSGGSKDQHLIGRDVLAVGRDEGNFCLEEDPQRAAYDMFSDARARMASRYQRLSGFMPGLSIVSSSAGDESSFPERLRREIEVVADHHAQIVIRRAIYLTKPNLRLRSWWFRVAYDRPNDEPVILAGACSRDGHLISPPADCFFAPDAAPDPVPDGMTAELVPGDYYEDFSRHPPRALQQLSGISVGGTHRLFATIADIELGISLSESTTLRRIGCGDRI